MRIFAWWISLSGTREPYMGIQGKGRGIRKPTVGVKGADP